MRVGEQGERRSFRVSVDGNTQNVQPTDAKGQALMAGEIAFEGGIGQRAAAHG